MEENEPEKGGWTPEQRAEAYRELDNLAAVAREHGGAPGYLVLPGDEQGRVMPTIVRIGQDKDTPHVLTIDIDGSEGVAPDVRLLVMRKHFESMLEDYLDT